MVNASNSYSAKLKDPRWQKKRLEILQRDNWKCYHCQSTEKTLHIHHRSYRGYISPWEYNNYDLITLCEDCHRREPFVLNETISLLTDSIRRLGMTSDEVSNILYIVEVMCKEEDFDWVQRAYRAMIHGDAIPPISEEKHEHSGT